MEQWNNLGWINASVWQPAKKTQLCDVAEQSCCMIQTVIQPSVSGSLTRGPQVKWEPLSDDSCCKWPLTFIVSSSCHDLGDHQLIHSVKKPALPSRLLGPRVTPHPHLIIISGLQTFVLRLWMMLFCVCLRNYGCRFCKEKKELPGKENRATTMLWQCVFLSFLLPNLMVQLDSPSIWAVCLSKCLHGTGWWDS